MNPGETIVRSPLDKPLGELNEEDIAQLTREDCRRFLKEKGMRRPSWNKSQAIQQVISLKALLEVRPDSDDPAGDGTAIRLKPPSPPAPVYLPSPRKEVSSDLQNAAAPENEPSPFRKRDPIQPPAFVAGESPCRFPVAGKEQLRPENHCASPRDDGVDLPAGQLTIFYGGMVNVFDGVSADKARAIMQLAASPDLYGTIPGPVLSTRALPARLMPAFLGPGPVAAGFPTSPSGKSPANFRQNGDWSLGRETEPVATDGPVGRKASLQRYLEKRKDRYKGKRVIGGLSSSSMEMMFLGQKFRGQTTNEQSSRSHTSSPTQPRPPRTPTRCSSTENQIQKLHLSLDLNEDGGAS